MKNKLYETVWTCDFCGKEFDTKNESDKHELTCKKIKSKEKNLVAKNAPFFSDNNKSFKIVAWVLIVAILFSIIGPMVIWGLCIWLVYKLFSEMARLPKSKPVSLKSDKTVPLFPKPIDIQPKTQTYSGYNATLRIMDNGIIISKKGGLFSGSAFLGGEKTIPYSSITAIEYKKPDMYPGWIRFSLIGVQQKSGPFAAAYDENAILFHFDPGGTFREAKEIIEDKMNKFHSQN
jgi:hypothetical protein